MTTPSETSHRFTNRLADETSPYLLQHAHNPVDWYPWGPEAFAAAKALNKPIFLSIGYSTCYWCHVMERQCFENEAIAREMNERFVNIKVDREERPDVDQLYMTAVQVLTRHGGWPMSVFLTPDLKPFYGGTYFPPTDAQGRPGFVTVLRAMEDAYKNRAGEVAQSTEQIVGILNQIAEPAPAESDLRIDEDFIDRLVDRSVSDYDPRHGGFGGAPKFPRQTLLELLLHYTSSMTGNPPADAIRHPERRKRVAGMVRHALDAMAHGGIRDHLGGGFHRYSTDAQWLVPHFEIMLYDNALLAWVYVEAYRQTEDLSYAKVARGIFDFILREMTSPQGAFYTALDAEVDGREGLNYLWTREEIESVLGEADAKVFNRVYGVDRGPNFADPHHGTGEPDRNILYLPPPHEGDSDASVSGADLEPSLEAMRRKLYGVRMARRQPLLDTKILTSWNALMIRALAYGGEQLQEQRYINAAAKAANFLLRHHRTANGNLIRTSGGGVTRDGAETPARSGEVFVSTPTHAGESVEPPATVTPPDGATMPSASDVPQSAIPGFLDDYAFFIQALIALRDASGREQWKDHAASLAMVMLDKFGDAEKGGFHFTDRSATDLIVRQKTSTDSPLPNGNAVAAMSLLQLDQPEAARRAIAVFARQLLQNGEGMSSMAQAALQYVRRIDPIDIAASDSPDGQRPASPQQVAGAVVTLRAAWDAESRLRLHVNILDGFHINAHEPSPGLIPTQLSITGHDNAHVESIDYPPGQERRFGFAEQPIRVYAGEIVIVVTFKTPSAIRRPILVGLQYQACDDNACLPPVTKQIEVGMG